MTHFEISDDELSTEILHAEIVRLRAELAVAQKRNSELLPLAAQCVRAVCHEHAVGRLERAEAAIDRVRELCASTPDLVGYHCTMSGSVTTERILSTLDSAE